MILKYKNTFSIIIGLKVWWSQISEISINCEVKIINMSQENNTIWRYIHASSALSKIKNEEKYVTCQG